MLLCSRIACTMMVKEVCVCVCSIPGNIAGGGARAPGSPGVNAGRLPPAPPPRDDCDTSREKLFESKDWDARVSHNTRHHVNLQRDGPGEVGLGVSD